MLLEQSQPAISEERNSSAGYYMIKSLQVKNFRCFKELELHELRRINVVVGKNATGKTALLEAVRLALSGTPTALWVMNQVRSWPLYYPQPPTRDQFESMWNPYFFAFNSSSPISMEFHDSQGHAATLKIYYEPKRAVTTVPKQREDQPPAPSVAISPLAFERTDLSGQSSTLYASVNPQGGYVLDPGTEVGPSSEFITSTLLVNPSQAAAWFSYLSLQKREKEIVDAVKEEFEPALESLSVLSLGQLPSVYASIKYLKEKLPLSLLSGGINKFVVVLAAVLMRGSGVVLIDEVENGFFYKTLEPMWKYLLKLAGDNDTQIFVSTHSQECVRALVPAMQGHEDEFTLLRAERTNGSSTVTLLEGKFLEAAIEQGVEVR
jgi:hypothetical protein